MVSMPGEQLGVVIVKFGGYRQLLLQRQGSIPHLVFWGNKFVTNYHILSYLNFDKQSYPWKSDIDYRKEPKIPGEKGEQGKARLFFTKNGSRRKRIFNMPLAKKHSARHMGKLRQQWQGAWGLYNRLTGCDITGVFQVALSNSQPREGLRGKT